MKVSEVKKLLRKNGCYIVRQGSRHEIWMSPATGKKFPVPRHAAQEVAAGTLSSIQASAGID